MYCQHFGLELFPFKITPDPAFLCRSSQNRRALEVLRRDFAQLSTVGVVTGDAGTGKTTLILHTIADMSDEMTVGLLSSFPSWSDEILPWVLGSFGVPEQPDEASQFEAFRNFVLEEYSEGRRCVLVIDEAQNVSQGAFEQLRKLVDMLAGKDERFMLILVGQNELHQKLRQADYLSFARLVQAEISLGPMSAEETTAYVRHRLAVAGGKPDIFDDEALTAVHGLSGGYPRLVNVVCDTALVMAYGSGATRIDKEVIGILGRDDCVLAHLPDIAERTRACALVDEPVDIMPVAPPPPDEESLFAHDVFDFILAKNPKIHDNRQGPSALSSPVPVFRKPTRAKAEITPDTSAPAPVVTTMTVSAATETAEPVALGSGSEPGPKAPSNAVNRKLQQSLARPSRMRGRFTGMLAASAVAAGVLALLPFDPGETVAGQSVEIAGVQHVSALLPVAPKGIDLGVPETIIPMPDMTGEALMERALAAGLTDPKAAALDYARAALRGEHLAAYYLGQLYETGDGVPLDLVRARSWYSSVSAEVRGARRRLEDLGDAAQPGDLAPPQPLLGGILESGGAEFVWTSGQGADPAWFVVELSDGPASSVRRLEPQEISALAVETVGDARFWRVFAIAPDLRRYAVSDWLPLGATNRQLSLGSGGVRPEAVIQLPGDIAPERLAAITNLLAASRIPFSIEPAVAESMGASTLQVGYFFEGDEDLAQTIADAVASGSAVQLAETKRPGRPIPFPGQVFIRLAPR